MGSKSMEGTKDSKLKSRSASKESKSKSMEETKDTKSKSKSASKESKLKSESNSKSKSKSKSIEGTKDSKSKSKSASKESKSKLKSKSMEGTKDSKAKSKSASKELKSKSKSKSKSESKSKSKSKSKSMEGTQDSKSKSKSGRKKSNSKSVAKFKSKSKSKTPEKEKYLTYSCADSTLVTASESNTLITEKSLFGSQTKHIIKYSYELETLPSFYLHDLEIDVKHEMTNDLADSLCYDSRNRHLSNTDKKTSRGSKSMIDKVSDGTSSHQPHNLNVLELKSKITDKRSGYCQPSIDDGNICTIYDGEIFARFDYDGHDKSEKKTRNGIIEKMKSWVENETYNNIHGIVAMKMVSFEQTTMHAIQNPTITEHSEFHASLVSIVFGLVAIAGILNAIVLYWKRPYKIEAINAEVLSVHATGTRAKNMYAYVPIASAQPID